MRQHEHENGGDRMELPQIVRKYMETFCRGDLDACLATFAPDGWYVSASTGQPITGTAIKHLFGAYFTDFPDLTCETIAVYAISEDLAVWRWEVCGTNMGSFRGAPPTGRSVVLRGCEFITIRGDPLSLLQQLGVLSPLEAAS